MEYTPRSKKAVRNSLVHSSYLCKILRQEHSYGRLSVSLSRF
jgi:hypothetical protein